ncbi:hypothetical protein GCK32_016270, partial [Trichostrongylus colubriformis]
TTNSLLSVNVDDRLKSDMQLKTTPKNDSLRTEDIDTRLKRNSYRMLLTKKTTLYTVSNR